MNLAPALNPNLYNAAPMRRQTIQSGETPEPISLTFTAVKVRVDNPTQQWLFVGPAGLYVAPGVMGAVLPLKAVTQVDAQWDAPPGNNQADPISAQAANLIWLSAAVDAPLSPGVATTPSTYRQAVLMGDLSDEAAYQTFELAFTPPAGSTKIRFIPNALNVSNDPITGASLIGQTTGFDYFQSTHALVGSSQAGYGQEWQASIDGDFENLLLSVTIPTGVNGTVYGSVLAEFPGEAIAPTPSLNPGASAPILPTLVDGSTLLVKNGNVLRALTLSACVYSTTVAAPGAITFTLEAYGETLLSATLALVTGATDREAVSVSFPNGFLLNAGVAFTINWTYSGPDLPTALGCVANIGAVYD